MRKILLAAAFAALVPFSGYAQTDADLVQGARKDTSNVLNYGMGYDLQRFSPLTQINRDTVKRLVPVWNYSYDDNKSEESQPLIYKGVLYVTTNSATMALDARPGSRSGSRRSNIPLEDCRGSSAAASSTAVWRCMTARSSAPRSTPMSLRWTRRPAKNSGGQTSSTGRTATPRRWPRWSPTAWSLPASRAPNTAFAASSTAGTRTRQASVADLHGRRSGRSRTPRPGPGDTWQHGGGSTWITGSFDPELHTVFWGTGNAGSVESHPYILATTSTPARFWRLIPKPGR